MTVQGIHNLVTKIKDNKVIKTIKERGHYFLVSSFVTGIIVGNIDLFYYAFIFLPEYRGSWKGASLSVWNFDVWTAYITSTIGIIFNGIFILFFIIFPGFLLTIAYFTNRKEGKGVRLNFKIVRKSKNRTDDAAAPSRREDEG